MKKKLLSISSLVLCFCLFFISCGCKPYKEVEKASKGLSRYEISMKLNPENMSFDVNQKVSVKNETDVILNTICFNIYAKAFEENARVVPYTSVNKDKCFPNGVNFGSISFLEILLEGNKAVYEWVGEDQNAIEIKLQKNFEPDDLVEVQMKYNLKLSNNTHRLGYFDGAINLGNFFPVLAVYEKGSYQIDPYYSTGDPFYSKLANYQVEISYPQEYLLSSSGYILKHGQENGQNIDEIEALAVRDFSLNLTKNASSMSRKVGNTEIRYVGYEGDQNIEECLNVAAEAFEFYNEKFGKYPYRTLDVVKTPFIHGGMEYPCMVTISDAYTDDFDIAKVISHEIAHQWWYAVVGNNQISEAWLDEALTEYSSVLFIASQSKYGVSYEELISQAFSNYVLYADIIDTINGKINPQMNLRVNEYASEYEYSYMVYVKGVLMFDSISQLIGKEKVVESLKSYYKKYKFKIAKSDDLIACFINQSKRDVGGVFDSWLNGKTVIGSIN